MAPWSDRPLGEQLWPTTSLGLSFPAGLTIIYVEKAVQPSIEAVGVGAVALLTALAAVCAGDKAARRGEGDAAGWGIGFFGVVVAVSLFGAGTVYLNTMKEGMAAVFWGAMVGGQFCSSARTSSWVRQNDLSRTCVPSLAQLTKSVYQCRPRDVHSRDEQSD